MDQVEVQEPYIARRESKPNVRLPSIVLTDLNVWFFNFQYLHFPQIAAASSDITIWVVFVGRRPRIYNTWGEAKTQVEGFPNNCHKSYDKREDAENDLRAFCTGGPSPTRGKVYVVFVSRKPGIYSSWYKAEKQVDRFRNNSFRAFKTRDDAEKAVAEFASSSN
ncbi:Hypothetical predicted protein [Olea europaea subsp. europaea]|uniref:Ribonuclease H1 N-terminal domain-containing protein n=1 Tax=Olea europaea subsp. europaea TaxID=158383 RepID=A0A8S0QU79_OLEEU|nr:Hypothetical predicted protein [Olea europaea subsp. europaea]